MADLYDSVCKFAFTLWHFLFSKMPRHARNCTAGSVYTYHEKMKDAQQSGYGTLSMRLGKDSIKVRQEFYNALLNLLVEPQWRCNVRSVINNVICLSFILGQSLTVHPEILLKLFLASEDSKWIMAFIAFILWENWVQTFSSCIQINKSACARVLSGVFCIDNLANLAFCKKTSLGSRSFAVSRPQTWKDLQISRKFFCSVIFLEKSRKI